MALSRLTWPARESIGSGPSGYSRLVAPTVTPPFVPEDVTGAVGCWVGDDLGYADDAQVSSWLDRITGKDLAQGTVASQPRMRTACSDLNDQKAIYFDGTGNLLVYAAANALSTSANGHVFVVANRVSTSNNGAMWSTADQGSSTRFLSFGFLLSDAPNGRLWVDQNNAGGQDRAAGGTTHHDTAAYLSELSSDGAAWSIRANGTSESVTATVGSNAGDWFADVANRDNFVVGAQRTSSTSRYFNGHIAFVLVVDGAISASDRTSLHAWVADKYGITVA